MRRTSLIRVAVSAAAVVTVSSAPPHIGAGSYVYDPESIPQNEKILKLFLRLAVHTANRLIRLKIKSNQDSDEFEEVPDYFSEVIGHPPRTSGHRMIGEPKFVEDTKSPPIVSEEVVIEEEEPTESPLQELESRILPDDQDPRDDEELQRKIDEVFEGETEETLSQSSPERYIDEVSATSAPEEESVVEAERRAFFDIDENNYVTQYNDQSRNLNRVDTTVNNNGVGQQQGGSRRDANDGFLLWYKNEKRTNNTFGKGQRALSRDMGQDDQKNATGQRSMAPTSHGFSSMREARSQDYSPAPTEGFLNYGLNRYQSDLDHVQRTISSNAESTVKFGASRSSGLGLF